MLAIAAYTALLLSPAVLAGPVNGTVTPRKCGTTISEEKLIAAEAHFAANKAVSKFSAERAASIQVYFHVVSEDDSESGGNIP